MAIRVLILASEYPHEGKEKDGIFIKDQAIALNRNDIRADVVFVEPRSVRSLSLSAFRENHFQTTSTHEDGVFTVRSKGWNPWMNSLWGGLAYAYFTEALVSRYILEYEKPDIIHAHNTFWAGYAALKIGTKLRIPYVVTEHSSRFLLNGITKRMLPYSNKVLASAETAIGVSRAVTFALWEFGVTNTSVIPNVVDTDYFSLPSLSRQTKPFVFLAIGNMNYNKGFHVLIRAFAQQFRGRLDIRLVFGGDGPQRCEFEALSKDLGLSDQVRFLGLVGRKEVRDALWGANALILPSFRETFGVVLIEALSTGIPVIATKSGGPEDIVTPKVGLLIDPGSETELSAAMVNIMESSYSEIELRNEVVNRYSEKAIVTRIKELYENVIEHSGKQRSN